MVDVDIQSVVDEVVKEKATLKNELEKYKESDQKLQTLAKKYNQALDQHKDQVAQRFLVTV
jgi:hypothetical protein